MNSAPEECYFIFQFPDNGAAIRTVLNRVQIKAPFRANLVGPSAIKTPELYSRFQNANRKSGFRLELKRALASAWQAQGNPAWCHSMLDRFNAIVGVIDRDGAVALSGLTDITQFSRLVDEYDAIVRENGSAGFLHSYVNLRDHANFLSDETLSAAYLHPLLIAALAYSIGDAIRIVDARAKDTGPISVRAQDNMLHIDNTPFRDEFKVLLVWERGTVRGPSGQNFVFLPGTHHAVRDCYYSPSGEAFSTENGSIFISQEALDSAFSQQRAHSRYQQPTVLEIQDAGRPVCVLFAAGSLVHHRYRTLLGTTRSCVIVAFHSVTDTPGALCPELAEADKTLLNNMLCPPNRPSASQFILKIAECAEVIAEMLQKIMPTSPIKMLEPEEVTLSGARAESWLSSVTSAPEIEDIKKGRPSYPFGLLVERKTLTEIISSHLMAFDKYGPLDLILYPDGREEIRKTARNRIREMSLNDMQRQLALFSAALSEPRYEHILMPDAVRDINSRVLHEIEQCVEPLEGRISGDESRKCAEIASFRQLIIDLNEAVIRPFSFQNYLSTCLFLFWSVVGIRDLIAPTPPGLSGDATVLLRHYIALAISVDANSRQELGNS